MAESVDALVSNTSGATHPGSTPGLGTISKAEFNSALLIFIGTSLLLCYSMFVNPMFF